MLSYSDIMIDIETLSTQGNAVITTIGAVKFNLGTQLTPNNNYFYRRINIQSCIDIGMETEDTTIEWWNRKKDTPEYEEIFNNKDRLSIVETLNQFSEWLRDGCNSNSIRIWSNGPSFDCAILKSAYKRCNIILPWKYWNERDVRTLYDLGGITKNNLNNHNALNDCITQIDGVNLSFSKIYKV